MGSAIPVTGVDVGAFEGSPATRSPAVRVGHATLAGRATFAGRGLNEVVVADRLEAFLGDEAVELELSEIVGVVSCPDIGLHDAVRANGQAVSVLGDRRCRGWIW